MSGGVWMGSEGVWGCVNTKIYIGHVNSDVPFIPVPANT